jgi:hypothetical protein
MKPEGLLPHSQEPVTFHHSDSDQSSPRPSHPASWKYILILFSHLRLGPPNGVLYSGLSAKTLYTPLLSPTRALKTFI